MAQKASNPVESYREMVAAREASKNAVSVDDLPSEQQTWLRATS